MCKRCRVTMTVDTAIDRPTIGENMCCTLFTLFFWYYYYSFVTSISFRSNYTCTTCTCTIHAHPLHRHQKSVLTQYCIVTSAHIASATSVYVHKGILYRHWDGGNFSYIGSWKLKLHVLNMCSCIAVQRAS